MLKYKFDSVTREFKGAKKTRLNPQTGEMLNSPNHTLIKPPNIDADDEHAELASLVFNDEAWLIDYSIKIKINIENLEKQLTALDFSTLRPQRELLTEQDGNIINDAALKLEEINEKAKKLRTDLNLYKELLTSKGG